MFTSDGEDQYKHREEAVVIPYTTTPGGSRGKVGGGELLVPLVIIN